MREMEGESERGAEREIRRQEKWTINLCFMVNITRKATQLNPAIKADSEKGGIGLEREMILREDSPPSEWHRFMGSKT